MSRDPARQKNEEILDQKVPKLKALLHHLHLRLHPKRESIRERRFHHRSHYHPKPGTNGNQEQTLA
jgi:hypothetical protein